MKKLIALALLTVLLAVSLSLLVQPASAADGDVALSGNDLATALNSVADGGTVQISGTCTVAAGFTWPSYDKSVTLSGGTLDLSAMGSTVKLGGNVTFADMTLILKTDATLYANGHRVVIADSVTLPNTLAAVYGGGAAGTTVASTDLTLLSGNYKRIYGGSNGGTVTGDTALTVGGTVNSACDWTSHTGTYNIYGGGNHDSIGGDVRFTFTGSAKANYIYGGSNGASATIGGNKYAEMSGGSTMSFYGGNAGVDTGKDNYTRLTGGTLQQLFGGNSGAAMTGNVDLRVLGGTVTRRIYGGCYNEATRSGLSVNWSSAYYVTGNIKVTVGGGANITLTYSDGDTGIYAISRQKTPSDAENAILVFADADAYSKYKSKTGAQDFGGMLIMGSASAADTMHYYTYTASGATVTETCAYHTSYSATATLALDSAIQPVYNGNAVTPAKITYSAGFEGDPLEITYRNNVNVGTATAVMERNGAVATLDFIIEKAERTAPAGLTAENETAKGKADGRILGLSTEMEYSTDGVHFTPVTDPDMKLSAGTYHVRYAETANRKASPATAVILAEGRLLTVTFVADGVTLATEQVSWGGALSAESIPAIPPKTGYTQTAPGWNVTDLSSITADLTVTAIYTANVYTVTFLDGDTVVATETVTHGAAVTAPAAPTKTGYTSAWDTGNFDTVVGDMTVKAVYTPKTYLVTFIIDGKATTKTAPYGTKLCEVVGAPAIPTKEGYDQTPPVWSRDGDTAVTANLTVTAVYTVNVYTVTFMDGATVVATETVTHGAAVTAPAVPAKEGYDSAWKPANFDTVTGDMTVNAVHTVKTYTVTFMIDGEAVTKTVTHGTKLCEIADAPVIPTKAGYDQTPPVWSHDGNTAVTADLTVTAVYTVNVYTVTFMDGDAVVATETVTHGAAVTAPAVPEKEGYDSVWKPANFDTVTGDMTVNAVHTVKTYTVTFMADGAVIETVTVNHGAPLSGTHIPPEKADHAAEWDAEIPAAITADMTFTAVYTPITPEPDASNGQQPDSDGEGDDGSNADGNDNGDSTNSGGTADGADSNAPTHTDGTADESGSTTVTVIIVAMAAVAVVGGVSTAVILTKKKGKKDTEHK